MYTFYIKPYINNLGKYILTDLLIYASFNHFWRLFNC